MDKTFKLKIVTGGFLGWYMRACKFDGWTSLWCTIYVLPSFEHDQRLLRHERCHLEQIERDGRIWFALKYSRWTIRHSYWNNHYEVESSAAEWKST